MAERKADVKSTKNDKTERDVPLMNIFSMYFISVSDMP